MRDLARASLHAYAFLAGTTGFAITAAGGGAPYWLDGDERARWVARQRSLAERKPATAALRLLASCAVGMAAAPLWLPVRAILENRPTPPRDRA